MASRSRKALSRQLHDFTAGKADVTQGFTVGNHKVFNEGVFFHAEHSSVSFNFIEHFPYQRQVSAIGFF